ncbi:MAG TPA: tetratricopeptide repeat protein [Verrucomicrobiae bacterium]
MKIKTVLKIGSLASVLTLTGCESNNYSFAVPDYKTPQQVTEDEADCRNQVRMGQGSIIANMGGAVALYGIISENNREQDIYKDCMISKGYILVVNTNAQSNSSFPIKGNKKPLLADSLTPVANANVVEIERAKAEKGDAEAQYQLGSCYFTGDYGATKDLTEAIKWYQKAADQNYPNMQFPLASAYAQRGVLELKNGDLDGALADFNKAIEVKPDFTEVYCARGYVKQCEGDLDGAMADCNKVIEMNPKLALVYSVRGLINYNLHKFTDALADFRKSCELSSDVRIQDGSYSYIWLIRARVGEQDAATKELQVYLNNRKTGTSDDCSSKVCPFLTGQLSEPDFFKAAENTDNQTNQEQASETVPEQHCEVYFYAGSKRLIEGDKTAATDYFKKCLATECKEVGEYNSAAVELKSLQMQ